MSQRATIDSLTGLRGIAALLVVTNHYFYWCSPYKVDTVPQWIGSIFATSDLGMTLFFTLSGFVITYNYLGFDWKRSSLATTARFVYLRFSRLYPALLIFMVIAMANWFPKKVAFFRTVPESASLWFGLHLFSAETWFPVKFDGVLPIDDIFHVSWSISTEFMLYLMFAATMIMWFRFARSRTGMLIMVAFIMVYIAVVVALAVSPDFFQMATSRVSVPIEPLTDAEWRRWFFYLSPYFRILNFAFGAAAAVLILHSQNFMARNRVFVRTIANVSVAALLAFQFSMHAFGFGAGHAWMTGFVQLVATALFAAVMLNCEDDTFVNRLLSSRTLVFLGEISYSLYLFHYLLPRMGVMATGEDFAFKYLPLFVINFALTLFLAIGFAAGIYRLLELPAQRMLRRLQPALHSSNPVAAKARTSKTLP